jgi:hypothetical protein
MSFSPKEDTDDEEVDESSFAMAVKYLTDKGCLICAEVAKVCLCIFVYIYIYTYIEKCLYLYACV